MTKPTIHLNGTGAESLLEGYRNAMEAVRDAMDKVDESAPNARDYYPQGPAAYTIARQEHDDRYMKLDAVRHELTQLAMHCNDIISERNQRRAERSQP